MKRVLFVATVVKTHILEFHVPYLKMFHDEGWQVDVAAKDDGFDTIPYCDNYYDIPFARNPFKRDNISAYKQLKRLIDSGEYDIIHCHTPVGGILTRLAARDARKKGTRVIYTAHGFHFYKGAPLLSWLLYYPAEKLCSRYTDDLITINEEDHELAVRSMHAGHIHYVPGVGLDLAKFSSGKPSNVMNSSDFNILSVGELNENKNHISVIRAIKKLNNPDIHYYIAGRGVLKETIEGQISELGMSGNVHLLGYRNDVPSLYKSADLFVHASIHEGMPVALMEAIASRCPAIVSDCRGNRDLVSKENVFSPLDVDGIAALILKHMDGDNSEEIIDNFGRLSDKDFSNVLGMMHKIYFGKPSYVSVYVRNQICDPASYYRLGQYSQADWILNDAVTEKEFYANLKKKGIAKKLYQALLLIKITVRRARQLNYDIIHHPSHIVIQRELIPHYIPRFILNKLKCIAAFAKLVWDFDDDIRLFNECSAKEFEYLKSKSEQIVVTNDYLNKMTGGRATLLPTTDKSDIDIDRVIENRKKRFKDEFTAVWVGSSGTLNNLELVDIPGLHVVCNIPFQGNVVNIPWSRETAKREMINAHLGIMPLKDEPYNYGKGAFKLIQYMSMGLPVMASSVGFNKEVVKSDFGFLDDFEVSKLSDDIELWEKMSRESYEEYRRNYSYESNLNFWKNLLV